MAGSSPFTVITNFLSLNLLNSVKTFRKNSIKSVADYQPELTQKGTRNSY